MKGSSRRDALTAKFLLPPYALVSSASTVELKPGGGRCTGNRARFARVRSSSSPGAGLARRVGWGEMKAGCRRSGAFSSPRGADQFKILLPQRLGPGAGEGRPGRKGPAQEVAFCSPAPPDPGSRKGSSLSLALHSGESPVRERKVSHCQHPPTNWSGHRGRTRGGAANVHMFTALGSQSPKLRCPSSPKMQTDSLLGVTYCPSQRKPGP